MKYSNLFLIILTGLLIMTNVNYLPAQDIKGNGNEIKETRSAGSFDVIENDGVINVFLTQGETESIVVEAARNYLPFIVTEVKDNTLFISMKKGAKIEKSAKLNVYVTFRDLKRIELNSVGNVSSENQLKLKNLTIENNSVGNIRLNIDCNELSIENNSVGNTSLSGNVNNVKIELNSVGNLTASDLKAQNLTIVNNAVGNVNVNAEKEIYITQNGTGNITYSGNAEVKKLEKNGSGNVKKK